MKGKVVQVIDDTTALKLVSADGDFVFIDKEHIKLKYTSPYIFLYDDLQKPFDQNETEDNVYRLNYADITNPSAANNLELALIIIDYLKSGSTPPPDYTTLLEEIRDAILAETVVVSKEAKQDAQITQLATLITNTTGLSQEATQLAIGALIDSINTNTTGINQEATQLLIKGVLDSIKIDTAKLDVDLSTRSAEATQLQVLQELEDLNNGSETNLATLLTELMINGRYQRELLSELITVQRGTNEILNSINN